jgi:HPt (histidine-containing phosphotransfer) domain-containing protein
MDRDAANATGPIDPTALGALVEMVGGDPEFLDELADAYLAEAPGHIAALRSAVERGSAADAVRPAHTLKSTSANLAALRLAALCRELEEQARAGVLVDAARRLRAVEDEFARAVDALAALREARWAVPEAAA